MSDENRRRFVERVKVQHLLFDSPDLQASLPGYIGVKRGVEKFTIDHELTLEEVKGMGYKIIVHEDDQ